MEETIKCIIIKFLDATGIELEAQMSLIDFNHGWNKKLTPFCFRYGFPKISRFDLYKKACPCCISYQHIRGKESPFETLTFENFKKDGYKIRE